MERVGAEGTVKNLSPQPQCPGQGCHPLGRAAQPGLEHLQGWSIRSFTWQTFTVTPRRHYFQFGAPVTPRAIEKRCNMDMGSGSRMLLHKLPTHAQRAAIKHAERVKPLQCGGRWLKCKHREADLPTNPPSQVSRAFLFVGRSAVSSVFLQFSRTLTKDIPFPTPDIFPIFSVLPSLN